MGRADECMWPPFSLGPQGDSLLCWPPLYHSVLGKIAFFLFTPFYNYHSFALSSAQNETRIVSSLHFQMVL